jgi:hypothetical protein
MFEDDIFNDLSISPSEKTPEASTVSAPENDRFHTLSIEGGKLVFLRTGDRICFSQFDGEKMIMIEISIKEFLRFFPMVSGVYWEIVNQNYKTETRKVLDREQPSVV